MHKILFLFVFLFAFPSVVRADNTCDGLPSSARCDTCNDETGECDVCLICEEEGDGEDEEDPIFDPAETDVAENEEACETCARTAAPKPTASVAPTATATATPAPEPLPTPAVESIRGYKFIKSWSRSQKKSASDCSRIFNPFDGYKTGFLWKQSDVEGRGAVTLFPFKFQKFESVKTWSRGKKFNTLVEAGYYTEDNQDRYFYRSAIPTKDYPKNVILKAVEKKKTGVLKVWCWALPDPTQRID